MEKHFNRALKFVLKHEGGYVPPGAGDPGGETKYGISKKAFPHLDIKNLTVEQAGKIYKKYYWNLLGCNLIESFIVCAKLFDVGVNVGVVTASTWLQRILRERHPGLNIDGKIGPVTAGVLNKQDPKEIVAALCCRVREHYETLLISAPAKYGKYRNGWLRRAAWFPKENEA